MSVLVKLLRNLFETTLAQWPDLVGTFYGVLLGGLATLAVVRWQISEGHRSREDQDKVFLTLLVEHVNREISQNLRVLKDLTAAFGQSAVARIEMWDWAVTISHSFSHQAHDDLYRTGLQRYLPPFLEEAIREANAAAFEVVNRVRQARARHIFNATYRDEGPELNDALYAETRALLPTIVTALEEADRTVDRSNLPWSSGGKAGPAGRGRGRIRRVAGRLRSRRASPGR
ncbi:hypothetical protein BH20GEM1_BH20GEM1_23090 [soil metagenome]